MHCVGKYENSTCEFDKFRFSEATQKNAVNLRKDLVKDKE